MRSLILILAVAFSFQAFSQLPTITIEQPTGSTPRRCATYEVIEGMRSLNPGMQTDAQFETWLQQKITEARSMSQRPFATVTLPVIFHIVHDNEAIGTGDNLPFNVIYQQVMQLNKDFANLSHSEYAVAADMEIQFALATTDPIGAPLAEPGIDRVNRVTEGFSAPPYTVGYASPANNYLNNTIKPATIWDPTRYLNIWVLEMESGILGIATFPGGSGLSGLPAGENASTSGVAVAPFSVGSVFLPNGGCGSAYGLGRTMTHEMGHFFGLRHIWGDGTCATDYCDDTPTHETSNSGVPSHPKPNSCGTPDEMFENYMDYSDDIVANTFTLDQKERMQAVLTNSPMRSTLPTSTVGMLSVVGSAISFYNCTGTETVSEAGTTGTYPRYRDLDIVINVENEAVGAATVDISAAGTASNGFHYQVMNPSLVFAAGERSKMLTVRIFDNAEVDGNRTIDLSYSITGTGVQAGSTAQTLSVVIEDDDNVAVSDNPITLLSEAFNTNITDLVNSGWATLTGGGTNEFVVSANGNAGGTGNCAHISAAATGNSNTYDPNIPSLKILRTPALNTNGITNLQLTFKYRVWGETDGGGPYDFGALAYLPASNPLSFSIVAGPYVGTSGVVSGNPVYNLPDATYSNASFHLGFYWENDNTLGNNPGFNIDDVIVTGIGTQVESTVSSSFGFDVRSAENNRFRSTNNRMIADINNSSENISGVAASITQSGNGLVALTTGDGAFSRSEKVIQLTPAVANTTASSDVTLYFTTAELAAWGADVPNLKVLKVDDGVNLGGIITTSEAELYTPVVNDLRATLGYATFTVSVTGGFSQFILVSPLISLPVDLIAFEATARTRSIDLDWSTAQENNNKGFVVERSVDGSNFSRIGWVDGIGTADSRSDYFYTDHFVQPGIMYYYRLRQTDFDLREKISVVRQAKIDRNQVIITLTPNPAREQFQVFISGSDKPADIRLVNMQGQLMKQWNQVSASAAPYTLNISGLAAGVYTVQVDLNGQRKVEKLVIK